jgi:hypothetical protein
VIIQRRRSRVRRLLTVLARTVAALVAAIVLAFLGSVLFIGLECYSGRGTAQSPSPEVRRVTAGLRAYSREEASTFLTLPEWYIVYNTEEYAQFLASHAPTAFPYVGSIRQYWRYYSEVCGETKGVYPFSAGTHLMLGVIGSSFSIEYALKGLYENTVGRATDWIAGHDTPEDAFAHATAVEYGAFMHTVPWYEFPFRAKLAGLWQTPLRGPHAVRKWERKLALSAEYGVKAVYSWLIGRGSKATYGDEDLRIYAWIENAGDEVFSDGEVGKVKEIRPRSFVVTMPRYEAFTTRSLMLIAQGVRFVDVAGNDEMLVTAIAPSSLSAEKIGTGLIFNEPLRTDRTRTWIAMKVPVRSLHVVVARLQSRGARIEHLYDY